MAPEESERVVTGDGHRPIRRDGSWGIVRVAVGATVLFIVVVLGAVFSPDGLGGRVLLAVSMTLFLVGSVMFLWAFVIAAGRSRDEQVTVAGVIWLTNAAPADVARVLRWGLVIQSLVAVTAAVIRPFSATAFGVLAPMFGLGCLALQGARHGRFAPIVETTGAPPRETPSPPPLRNEIDEGTQPTDSPAVVERDRSDPDDFDQLFRRRG